MRPRWKILACYGVIALLFCGHILAANHHRTLFENWQFRKLGEGQWRSAQVPGTVHTDLYAAGSIPDPYFAQNAASLDWIEKSTWEYRSAIILSPEEARARNKSLEFQGLDTYADIYVNGKLLLQTDNMFRSWELDLDKVLTGKKDSLRIVFHPPSLRTAKEFAARPYRLPADNDNAAQPQSVYSRKAAYHFGWDWAPRMVTAGIWRPIVLHTSDRIRILDFNPATLSILPNVARMQAQLNMQVDGPGTFRFTVFVDGRQVVDQEEGLWQGTQSLSIPFEIANPKLWWPAGAGAPNRYQVSLRVSENGQTLDSVSLKAGIRSIALLQENDKLGRGFSFSVNGRPIFIRGTNYVPGDMFLPRAVQNRGQIIKAMQAVNMNMVRIWGGGIYEDEAFYNACDSLGILVWQDFMFAGGMFPFDDAAFRRNVEAEVTQVTQRLRRHPSVAIYCGNNEVEVAWFNWGWQKKYGIGPADSTALWNLSQAMFTEVIPGIVEKQHPGIPYIPSSPISNWGSPERYRSGNMHDWSVWHGNAPIDSLQVRAARFVTEYGFQSYPGFSTVELYSMMEDRIQDSEWMKYRQKSYKGNAPILSEINRIYGAPRDFAAFLSLSQMVQALAMEYAIETHRTQMPACMGSMYWQLNDCWPGPSWSSIDYLGRWKPAHYALKRLYAPMLVSAREDGKDLVVRLASDIAVSREATVQVRLKSFTGGIIAQQEKVINIPSDGSAEIFRMPLALISTRFDRRSTVVEATVHAGGQVLATDALYLAPIKELRFPDPQFSYKVTEEGDHYLLVVEADHLLKDVEVRVQGSEAELSDNFFDFLPGRRYEIQVRNVDVANAEDLLKRLRFRDISRLTGKGNF